MVISKRMSLKALSALQNHEGGGRGGNKNNCTNVSLRLCIIIHQYIDAHTLSPSLPLPLIHTDTHTTHYTNTYTADQADVN